MPTLEIEVKDLKQNVEQLKRELETSSKENVANRSSIDDFKKKLEEAKKNQQRMGGPGEDYDQRGHAIQRRPGAKQN